MINELLTLIVGYVFLFITYNESIFYSKKSYTYDYLDLLTKHDLAVRRHIEKNKSVYVLIGLIHLISSFLFVLEVY